MRACFFSLYMQEAKINFTYKARYYQTSAITAKTKRLIFVIHGYGQQAKYFIRKFEMLADEETCIVAPEGLSRFYLEGFSGRVGATWMTKEDRLTDIENYLSYLSSIYRQLVADHTSLDISVLGFSQGAATASRWVAYQDIPLSKLVLWAGIFPPDMDMELAAERLRNKQVYYVYGLQDPFLNREKLDEMKQISDSLNIKPIKISFEGVHDIYETPLKQVFGR